MKTICAFLLCSALAIGQSVQIRANMTYAGTHNFSGATVVGISGGTGLSGFAVTKSSQNLLVDVGSYRYGSTVTTVSSASTCSPATGVASETAIFYLMNGSLNAASATNTISCTTGGFGAFNFVVGSTFPAGSIPLASWHMTSGAFDANGTDLRSPFFQSILAAGTGMSITPTSTGYTIGPDTGIVLFYADGTSVPGSCNQNEVYFHTGTATLYKCVSGTFTAFGGGGSGGETCTTGSIPYTSLTAAATSQEITILSNQSAKFRYRHVMLQEATQFSGTPTLTASVGTTGVDNDLLLPLTLKSGTAPQNYGYDTPRPPAVGTGTYNVVVQFVGGANLSGAFSAGSLNWEVCGITMP